MVQAAERTAAQILDLLHGGDGSGLVGVQSLERTLADIRDELPAALAGAGAGALQESDWVQITDAEFKDLDDTPKQLVAAGGAGVVRIVVQWALYFKTMIVAYADGGALTLITHDQGDFVTSDYIGEVRVTATVGTKDGAMLVADAISTTFEPDLGNLPIDNQAIDLYAQDTFTGGDAGNLIYAKVWYVEVELP